MVAPRQIAAACLGLRISLAAALYLTALTLLALVLSGCLGEPPPRSVPATYTVKSGDTLYAIALRLRLDYRELARWNAITDPNLIRTGQVLRLQPDGRVAASAPRVPVTPMPRPANTSAARTSVPPTAPSIPSPSTPSIPPPPPVAAVRWQWPLEGGVATLTERPNGGQGLNISGELGQPVLAAADGKVVYTGTGLLGYGQLLIIKHNESYLSAYGHIESVAVIEGDSVLAGQRVAAMGSGPQGAPLLYFEIRLNGAPGNPLLLLPQRASYETGDRLEPVLAQPIDALANFH
jgi:lipoprotein NlpD